jgi:type IX secretion system PorP/SprF family membrane protein
MKKQICLLLFLFVGLSLSAQQEHQYTQFMYNKLLINPGYAGARGVPSFSGLYRTQWMGFEGAPQSALFSLNTPFLTPRVGVGITISSQKIGLQRDFYTAVAYSYELLKSEMVSLRLGLMGALRSRGYDFTKAILDQQSGIDASIDPDGNGFVRQSAGNVGSGIYATFADRYYFGFSIPHIYSNLLGVNNPNATLFGREFRHYYASAGAIFPIADDINLMPAILLKYVKHVPFDAEINVNLDFKQKFTAGMSYRVGGDRSGESLDLLLYWQMSEQIGVGLAYDIVLSRVKNYSSGSFEVMMQADLKRSNSSNKKKKNMTNPRFFM